MTEPETELDNRFSNSGAVATQWEDARRLIESAQLFWIATVRSDGRPHVTPLVAVWLDDALHFTTGPDEQKAINLQANAHVILLTGCNDWDHGLDVVVEGVAHQVHDDETLTALADAWTRKWDGSWQYEVHNGAFHHSDGDEALVFRVKPAKVLAFGKAPSATPGTGSERARGGRAQ